MILGTAASIAMAFVLGLRHGLDADHLAAIDGLTRWNARRNPQLSSVCGLLFSAGHVAVILAMALVLSSVASRLDPPHWLALVGALISASTLVLLGVLNLRAALSSNGAQPVQPIGLRSGWFGSVLRAPRSWQVALVGALFALSFDAVAIAALFTSSSETALGAMAAACCFALGMIAIGTANGFWVMRLVGRSTELSERGSRAMTLTIALVSLGVSACVLLALASAAFEQWVDAHGLVISVTAVALVLLGYFASVVVANRKRAAGVAGAPGVLN